MSVEAMRKRFCLAGIVTVVALGAPEQGPTGARRLDAASATPPGGGVIRSASPGWTIDVERTSPFHDTHSHRPESQEGEAGRVQARGRVRPAHPERDQVLLATIEWPFTQFERTFVPPEADIRMFYDGFYNPAPCMKGETSLAHVSLPWGTSGFVHRYEAATDPWFAGFMACLTNGTDEVLSIGVEGVSGWTVKEAHALNVGLHELGWRSVAYAELEVDQLSTEPSAGAHAVRIVMRWRFYGR